MSIDTTVAKKSLTVSLAFALALPLNAFAQLEARVAPLTASPTASAAGTAGLSAASAGGLSAPRPPSPASARRGGGPGGPLRRARGRSLRARLALPDVRRRPLERGVPRRFGPCLRDA